MKPLKKLLPAFAAFFLLVHTGCKKEAPEPNPESQPNCNHVLQNWNISSVQYPDIQKQHDLFFPEPQTGYTAGNYGTMMKTVDGGDTWTVIHSGNWKNHVTRLNLNTLYFLDATMGFAGGDRKIFGGGEEADKGAVLLKTTDGGASWSKLYFPHVSKINDLHFFDPLNGIGLFSIDDEATATTQPALMETRNGGAAWEEIPLPAHHLKSATFLDTPSGFYLLAADSNGYDVLLRSTDRGMHWDVRALPSEYACDNLYFINDDIGFASFWQPAGAIGAFQTRDGGRSWEAATAPFNFYSFAHFKNETEGFLINPVFRLEQASWELVQILEYFEVFQTTDGGATWAKTEIDRNCDFTGISHAPSKEVLFSLGNTINRFEVK